MSNKDIDSIYNALDRGDYAKAQQICEKPEVSKYTLTQALLAYTYASQRKNEKALELGRKLLQTEPADESTVNALGCAFKLCHSDVDFAACYEIAIRKNPAVPPHFHSELFYSYLRMNDIKKMQSVAQRAFKSTDNPRYVAWMATCILLQPDLPPTMLAVAEKMMRKIFQEIRGSTAPGSEELLLFITILAKESKLLESADFVEQLILRPPEGTSSGNIQDEDHFRENTHLISFTKQQKLLLELDLHLITGKFDKAVVVAYSILEELPDQWNVYKVLHQIAFSACSFELVGGSVISKSVKYESFSGLSAFSEWSYDLNSSAGLKLSPDSYHSHLLSLMQRHPRIRGPWLAHLYCMLQAVLPSCSKGSVEWEEPESISQLLQNAFDNKEANEEISRFLTERCPECRDEAEKLKWSRLSLWLHHALIYIEKFKGKYCLFADIKEILHTLFEEAKPQLALEALNIIIHWINHRMNLMITAGDLERIFPQLPAKDANAGVGSSEGAKDGDDEVEEEDEKEVEVTESKSTAVNSTKKKKKANKKKKNSSKHAKANQSNAPLKEEKKLDVDFDHVNRVGTKDNLAVETICSYGELDTVRSYCSLLVIRLSKQASSLEGLDVSNGDLFRLDGREILVRLKVYQVVFQRFVEGVNGEMRTIQPADDLMVLTSAVYYEALSSFIYSQQYNAFSLAIANEWFQILQFATKASPFNSKLKLDMLLVSRYLGNTSAAFTAFQNLGVKHIQYDSLSFLVVPNYIEGGFLSEALKIYRSTLSFHRLCQKECIDMLGKGFEYSNYNKILEVFQFAQDCKKSLQLWLAKAELPLLEVALENAPTLDKVQEYLVTLIEDQKYPEYLPYLEREVLTTAISNLDTKIVDRFQYSPRAVDHSAHNETRNQQIISRISISQSLLYSFYYVLKKDATSLQKCLLRLDDSIERLEEVASPPFSQRISSCVSITRICWKLIALWLEVATALLTSEQGKSVLPLLEEIKASELSLVNYFLSQENIFIDTIKVDDEEKLMYISPVYLKSVSSFVYIVRVWVPLLQDAVLPLSLTHQSEIQASSARWREFRANLKKVLAESLSLAAASQQKFDSQTTLKLKDRVFESNLPENEFPPFFVPLLESVKDKFVDLAGQDSNFRGVSSSVERMLELI